jgi:hypothetical protein
MSATPYPRMSFALVILDSAMRLVNSAEFATFCLWLLANVYRVIGDWREHQRWSSLTEYAVSQVFFLIGWAGSYHLLQSMRCLTSRLGRTIYGESDTTAELQQPNLTPVCVEFGPSNHSLPSTAPDDLLSLSESFIASRTYIQRSTLNSCTTYSTLATPTTSSPANHFSLAKSLGPPSGLLQQRLVFSRKSYATAPLVSSFVLLFSLSNLFCCVTAVSSPLLHSSHCEHPLSAIFTLFFNVLTVFPQLHHVSYIVALQSSRLSSFLMYVWLACRAHTFSALLIVFPPTSYTILLLL